jgi:hypothetical protein
MKPDTEILFSDLQSKLLAAQASAAALQAAIEPEKLVDNRLLPTSPMGDNWIVSVLAETRGRIESRGL